MSNHSSTIRDIVTDRNATAPARAISILADMVALAEIDNAQNACPSDGDSPIGAEITWMLVRTMCREYGVAEQPVIREARDNATRRYAEIKDEAYEIDRHDRFAVPDPNKERAASALIELIEG